MMQESELVACVGFRPTGYDRPDIIMMIRPSDRSLIRGAFLVLLLLGVNLLLISCEPATETIWNPDQEIKRLKANLPLEVAARESSEAKWDQHFEDLDLAHKNGKLADLERKLNRVLLNDWKSLAARYPSEDERARLAIDNFRSELDQLDISLLVLWLPNLVDTHAASIADLEPASRSIDDGQTRLQLDLLSDGVRILDLRAPFREAARGGSKSDPFEKLDYHWSAIGIELAADAVAKHLNRSVKPDNEFSHRLSQRLRYVEENTSSEQLYEGIWVPRMMDATEILLDGAPYRPQPGASVLVMGDSMIGHLSADKPHGVAADFAAHLAFGLQSPVNVVRQNGGAQLAPMLFARKVIPSPEPLPELVVWVLSGVHYGETNWPITDLPSAEERQEQITNVSAASAPTAAENGFLSLVKYVGPPIDLEAVRRETSESPYPATAYAATFEIIATTPKEAIPEDVTVTVYQKTTEDREALPSPALSAERMHWMWLVPAATAEDQQPELGDFQRFNEAAMPLEQPMYWKVD